MFALVKGWKNTEVTFLQVVKNDVQKWYSFLSPSELKDKYIINVTATNICLNCDNPVKKPEEKIILKSADFGEQNETGGQFSSTTAV